MDHESGLDMRKISERVAGSWILHWLRASTYSRISVMCSSYSIIIKRLFPEWTVTAINTGDSRNPRYWFILQGGVSRKGYLRRRITVTLSIFNFSTCFLAQIVENRGGVLLNHFYVLGIFFWKVMTKTRSCSSESACVHPDLAGDGSPADRRSRAVMYGRTVFVITFRKIVPRT